VGTTSPLFILLRSLFLYEVDNWNVRYLLDRCRFVTAVSQSVDLGRSNNPNTTPTKDYEIVRVVVYLCGVQRGYAEEGERGSTPTG